MKTLKDLPKVAYYDKKFDGMDMLKDVKPIAERILKEEAIKWIKQDIKDYRTANIALPEREQGRKIHNFIVQQRQKWKDRFNITEEDLK